MTEAKIACTHVYDFSEGKMIYINDEKSALEINQFSNLEEVIEAVNEACTGANQIITAVFLNGELFQELYPHQAEDIEIGEIQKVEFTAMDYTKMALEIVTELYKVTEQIRLGSMQASKSLRSGDDMDALITINNLSDVIRDFLNMVTCLKQDFSTPESSEFNTLTEKYSQLIDELTEAMANEDWILVADLLEFEIAPLCADWNNYLNSMRDYFSAQVNPTLN